MEDYAGLIVTIEYIYYDEQDDYFSYLVEEDDENFYWEDSFFDDSYKDINAPIPSNNDLSLDVNFMRFMLGKLFNK